MRRYYCEIFISFKHTHHVFHGISVRFSKCSISMPVCHFLKLEKGIHNRRIHNVIFKRSRRIFKRVIVVITFVLIFEFIKKIFICHIHPPSSFCEVSKSIVSLSFCIYDLFTWSFFKISLILPFLESGPSFSIVFKETRPVLGNEIIKELLWSHCSIITNCHSFIVMVNQIWSLCSVFNKSIKSKVMSDAIVK